MTRPRLRELGMTIGEYPTGEFNAITDVPGIMVGHKTLVYDEPRIARTGVTMIVPRDGDIWSDHCFAAHHSFNGNGEMSGIDWVEESGLLTTPIGITNTHQVGLVRDALVEYAVQHQSLNYFILPVVGETYDGFLNDINAFHITTADAFTAIANAQGGVVAEGNVGGGTGMRCHGFKGGIGTSSRIVPTPNGNYTLGALVQANYGARRHLRVDGVPVGVELSREIDSAGKAVEPPPSPGSIIVILATNAPLIPTQCKRLAQRATVGLARVGGVGHNSSGDLFLAFATGNHLPAGQKSKYELTMLPHAQLDPFFEAAAEAVEESILNAMTAAETMTGFKGTVEALPLDKVVEIMRRYGRQIS